jgi:hypothetical protein
MTHIADVIGWKFNNQQGMDTFDGVITAFPGGIPSQEDQDKWIVEYEAHLAATAYRTERDYGSIQDELDMIYWDQVNGTTTFKDHAAAVKAAHPKPE